MDWQPLDFEKPIFELERRLQDLKSHSTKHDVDLGSAVKELEAKLRETRRHISEAIAVNLREMMKLRVPVIAAVIGEGGSGGALGIGVADHVLIFENAYYSVISPEACSAILWRDRRHAAEAAEALKLTAQNLLKLEVVDEIIREPEGGAHRDYDSAAVNLGEALRRSLERLSQVPVAELLEKRYRKFRRLGVFSEGTTVPGQARI